jgi:asparagine synthase (glutamine-hydrolysing)
MFRYLGIAWDVRSEQECACAQRARQRAGELSGNWHTAIDAPGLLVRYTDARASCATALSNEQGVILGTLFQRHGSTTQPTESIRLTVQDWPADAAAGGRHLIQNYWGRYVAFLRSPDGARAWILRDPSGTLPCYITAAAGVRVFFSWTDDARALGLSTCSINWSYVARFVCCSDPQSRETGISEIQELNAGEQAEVQWGHLSATQQLWDVARVANTDPIDDVETAVREVRVTTKYVAEAWAARYSRIVHLLSGGLDSSVLLWCLHTAAKRPAITCLNYFGSAANEDERALARLAKGSIECDLVERPQLNSTVRLARMLECERTAVPLGMLYRLATEDGERQLAQAVGADAYFTGVGGDAVFYQGPVTLALADHLRRYHGAGGFMEFALSIARMEGLSLAAVLMQAARDLRPGHADPVVRSVRNRAVVNSDVLRAATKDPALFWHRWPMVQGAVSPAKLRHLYYMRGNGIHFYSPFHTADDPDYVCPLLSQPLMELCSRIPVHVHTAAGWDRAIERRAFSDVVHPKIIHRRRKGGVNTQMRALLQANLPFVKELMLDGLLVKQGLLDRDKIEQALSGARVALSPAAGEIFGEHLSLEAWLQRWNGGQMARADHSSTN